MDNLWVLERGGPKKGINLRQTWKEGIWTMWLCACVLSRERENDAVPHLPNLPTFNTVEDPEAEMTSPWRVSILQHKWSEVLCTTGSMQQRWKSSENHNISRVILLTRVIYTLLSPLQHPLLDRCSWWFQIVELCCVGHSESPRSHAPAAWTCEDWCQNLLDPLFMRTVRCRRAHWTKLLNDSMEIRSIFDDHHLIFVKTARQNPFVGYCRKTSGKPKNFNKVFSFPTWKDTMPTIRGWHSPYHLKYEIVALYVFQTQ